MAKTLEYLTREDARIVRKLVRAILAAGYTVSVNDDYECGGEWVLKASKSYAAIVNCLGTTGGDFLRIRDDNGQNVGCVVLIYNGDGDVVQDCSESMNAIVQAASI